MPYSHFPEDEASLWYEANFPVSGGIAQLHPGRQTILLLPYIGLDIASLVNQFQDPILSTTYNLLAVDFWSQGKTVNPTSERHDCWVDAASLLKVLARLQIQQIHVFAGGALSIGTALRLALLWPTGIQSLAVLSVHKPVEQWLVDTFKEIIITLGTAKSLEEIEDIINELFPYLFYDGLPDDELDFFAAYITRQYPPSRISRFNDMLYDFLTQWLSPLTSEHYSLIRQPVLIISPEDTMTSSREEAEDLKKLLINSVDPRLKIIDTPGTASYYTRCSYPKVNQLYTSFLRELSPRTCYSKNIPNMQAALRTLAKLTGNTNIQDRDPQKAFSFSCVSAEDVAEEHTTREQLDMLGQMAVNPVDPAAELPRKFSERHNQNFFGKHRTESNGEWLYAAIDVRVGQGEHVGSDSGLP
ncbi:alpha/beta-hydrolase [Dacryopinax primogenitus]|uniref:Alpha/beta-hydrolase n=1 Tax=Dacryopinax primogenitus (strain DJM 731) TaxID=1858805 RepID=M5FTM8_DACPD|nr:alpha/beta-hydrolase [Dacryopinax primogenitus]EJT98764.1 alpha/beta-hydrolase [Dacryopinax primogenitus]